jgi:hypothetical protein
LFAWPPNYESIRKGDRPETAWILQLDAEVCIEQSKQDPLLDSAHQGIRKVQLVFLRDTRAPNYEQSVTKRVTAKGTLFGAHTEHHRTDVLLTVETLTTNE